MKYFLYYIGMILIFFCCMEKEYAHFTISGQMNDLNDSVIYVVSSGLTDNMIIIDTIPCKNGRFFYKASSDSLTPLVVYVKEGEIWFTVWVKDMDHIVISGDVNIPELIMAKGNETNDLLSLFKEQNMDLLKEFRSLTNRKHSLESVHDSLSIEYNETKYTQRLSNINYQLREKAEDFIQEHPTSVASLVLLRDYLLDAEDAEHMQNYLSLIEGEATEVRLYKDLTSLCIKFLQSAVGSKAPDFLLINTQNDTLSLQSFEGKYLLLNFVTTSCEPCITESNDFVKIRKKYTNKKIELLSIVLEESEKTWLQLVKENNYAWHQVIDTLGWDSPIASNYNVTYLPSNFLIDKDQIIVAKNLTTDSIMAILGKTKN